MPSRFPGMDPYLEQDAIWPDVHNAFCLRLRAALNRSLPSGYVARVEERLIVEADDLPPGQRVADVAVNDAGSSVKSIKTASNEVNGTVAVVVPPVSESVREVYLEVLDNDSGDLVTVIELLSPSNRRPNSHRNEFLQKRDEILSSDVNYVEIDLLRESPRLPIEGLPDCAYYVLVRTSGSRRNARVHAIQLTDRLPNVMIPLRAEESVAIDLQEVFDEMFEEGRYAPAIYRSEPNPPLTPEQLAWAESLASP